jgi:hypothetical protein
MKRLFKIGIDRHDSGRVIFSWNPDGNFLATAGKNGKPFSTFKITHTSAKALTLMIL